MSRERFGTTESGIVSFDILMPARATSLPSWSSPRPNIVTNVIPGSSPPRTEREVTSIGPSGVTWQLQFSSLTDYWAMQAKLGTVDTLMVMPNTQTRRGGSAVIAGVSYVVLPYTSLDDLDEAVVDIDGSVEANVTFFCQINPATGEAVLL